MDPAEEEARIAMIKTMLDHLVERGWISQWGAHQGRYILQWTEKGRERSKWVNTMAEDLQLGPEALTALIIICHLHAPR